MTTITVHQLRAYEITMTEEVRVFVKTVSDDIDSYPVTLYNTDTGDEYVYAECLTEADAFDRAERIADSLIEAATDRWLNRQLDY